MMLYTLTRVAKYKKESYTHIFDLNGNSDRITESATINLWQLNRM